MVELSRGVGFLWGGRRDAAAARRRGWRRAATATPVLALALLAAGCTDSEPSSATSATPSATSGSAASVGAGGLAPVAGLAARLQPSVVTVLVEGGNGSGVVYTADGLILTNEHVVRGNTNVQIAFADGQQVPGTVKATDPVTDLALVQANRRNLPPVRFQSRLPAVGSLAVVLGSPLGFQNTVSAGIISGLHREIPGSAAESQALVDLIQTDAAISPGNSGGAVVDADGEVIGISLAYIPPQSGAVSLGFAIPAATAVDIAGQLRSTGRARHAFAGLVPAPITAEIAEQFGLSSTDGTIVAGLTTGGPAERAGLRLGDIITAVDGKATRSPEEFLAALRQHRPGDTLTLAVKRPGAEDREVRLTVTDRPAG